MPADGDDAACTGAGVRKPSMKETAMGEGWWYMSRVLSSPISRPPLHFRPFFVRPEEPFFRSDPGVCGARRARSVKDGAIAPPAGLSLTDRAPRYAGAIEGDVWLLSSPFASGGSSLAGSASMAMSRAMIASAYIRQLRSGLPLCCMHGRSRR